MEADNITIAGAQGSDGQVLTSTGSGVGWEDASGGGVTLTGSTNNTITTVTGADAIQGEANLTFDGTNLGIGTTSPSQLLHISSTGDAGIYLEADSDNSNEDDNVEFHMSQDGGATYFKQGINNDNNSYINYSNEFVIQRQGGEKVRIDDAGNVGIGTTSPVTPLEVNGVGFINASGSTTGRFVIRNSTTGAEAGGIDIQQIGVNAEIYNDSNGYLRFGTNNAERMRIESDGKVGIGTTSPVGELTVSGDTGSEMTNSCIMVQGYSPAIEWRDKDSVSNWYWGIDDNESNNFIMGMGYGPGQAIDPLMSAVVKSGDPGWLGIGTNDPGSRLTVAQDDADLYVGFWSENSYSNNVVLEFGAGTNPADSGFIQSSIKLDGSGTSSSQKLEFRLIDNSSVKMYLDTNGINGTLVGSSDESLKENVQDLSDGTTVIKALQPRIFDWKEDEEFASVGTGQAGFIAQEVENVFGEAVSGDEGRKGIKLMAIIAHAVKAIQELEERIETLENT